MFENDDDCYQISLHNPQICCAAISPLSCSTIYYPLSTLRKCIYTDTSGTLGANTIPPGAMRVEATHTKAGRPTEVKITAPRKFSYDASVPRVTGLRWEPLQQCRLRHFTRRQLQSCLDEQWHFKTVFLAGDSVTGGLSRVLKWMVGVNNLSAEWYLQRERGSDREIVSSEVSLGSLDSHTDNTNNKGRSRRSRKKKSLSISNLKCILEESSTCIKKIIQKKDTSPILVIINFKIHHLMAHFSTASIATKAANFFTLFEQAVKLHQIHPLSRFIFISAMATLKFREVYCTTTRAQIMSDVIASRARQTSQWLVIDAFNMTMMRPDLSHDGNTLVRIHYFVCCCFCCYGCCYFYHHSVLLRSCICSIYLNVVC